MKDNENNSNNNQPKDWSSASDWFTQRQSERINTSGGRFETNRQNEKREVPQRHEEPYMPSYEKAPERRQSPERRPQKQEKKIELSERKTSGSYMREERNTDKAGQRKKIPDMKGFAAFARKNKNSGKSKDELRREFAEKKRKQRRRRIIEWFVFTALIFVAIFIVASLTVLFHIETVTVSGETRYSAEEIIEASGIETGDNLWLTKTSDVSSAVSQQLPYIGKVKLSRKIPSSITVVVEETEAAYAVAKGKRYILVDKTDKILELNAKKSGKAVVIGGLKLSDPEPGQKVQTETPENYQAAKDILKCAEENKIKLVRANVSDLNNISAVCSDIIRLDFGSATQLSEKMQMANEVMSKLKEEGSLNEGVINLKSTSKAFYKDGPIVEVTTEPPTEETTQPQTDENGNAVTTQAQSTENTEPSSNNTEMTASNTETTAQSTSQSAPGGGEIPDPPATRPQG